MPSLTTEGQSCTSEYIDMVSHMRALYQCHTGVNILRHLRALRYWSHTNLSSRSWNMVITKWSNKKWFTSTALLGVNNLSVNARPKPLTSLHWEEAKSYGAGVSGQPEKDSKRTFTSDTRDQQRPGLPSVSSNISQYSCDVSWAECEMWMKPPKT